MSPDAAEIRAWARGNGYDELGDKGRIPATVRQAYEQAHGLTSVVPDYPPDMDEDDFAEPGPPPPGGDDPETGETRPGAPALKKPGARGRLNLGRKTRTKSKHARPRVPVDEAIGNGWRIAARFARPIPPLERTLKLQSVVAGQLLEDSVKGTVVDKALQPVARFMSGGKVGAALVGPPLLVTAISLHVQQRTAQGLPPNPFFMNTAIEMLREALMLWMEVSGPKFEAAIQREKEFEERHGGTVDAVMQWLLSEPANPNDPASVRQEEFNLRRAQGFPVEYATAKEYEPA